MPKSYTEMKQKSGLRLLQATISAQVMRVSGCESGTMQVTKPKVEAGNAKARSTDTGTSSTMSKGPQHPGFRWIPIECHNLPSLVQVFRGRTDDSVSHQMVDF